MKKLISTTILCMIFCFLPIIGKPNLYLNSSFLTVVFFFYLLFFTQPTFEATDMYKNAETDKFSMGFITLGVVFVLSGSLIYWAYFKDSTEFIWNKYSIAGLSFLLAGSGIRIWSIRYLGKFFTNSVQFDSGHQLITTGPYKLIRHPSYLGAYLAIIGSALFLNAIVIFCIGIVVMLAAYLYRIHVEEIGLVKTFEKEYPSYQARTKRLIPFIY